MCKPIWNVDGYGTSMDSIWCEYWHLDIGGPLCCLCFAYYEWRAWTSSEVRLENWWDRWPYNSQIRKG